MSNYCSTLVIALLYLILCQIWPCYFFANFCFVITLLWPCYNCIESVPSYIYGLAQDCSNSIPNTLELLQSCTKPSIWHVQWSSWGVYWFPAGRPASCVCSVAPKVLVGSISYLCILLSNFRRCVACKISCKIIKFEFLAIFLKFVTLTLSCFDLGSDVNP